MSPPLANIALPVIFPQPLLMLAMLLPIVGVEALTLRRRFAVPYGGVFEANLISTIIGIPISFLWISLCNWLINDSTGGWGTIDLISRASLTDLDALWVLSALVVGVIVPCFALSVLVEGHLLQARLGIVSDRSFWYRLIRAHCYSYLVLLAANFLWFIVKSR